MTDPIHAPWTPEQTAALNRFQHESGMHPFTCPADHPGERILTAHADGWHCPDHRCGYWQEWAHAFMADPETWPTPPDPAQCSGEEGFCPEHGFHRHSLKQPGNDTASDTPQHACDNCEGVDPDSCLMNEHRPRLRCSCGGRWPIQHLHADEHRPIEPDIDHALAFGESVELQPAALPNNGEQSGRTTLDNSAASSNAPDNPAPGRYLHYKGGRYEVAGTATHTESGDRLVVYRDAADQWWARPVADFTGSVVGGTPRFTPDNSATSSDTADNPLRERIAEAARPWLLGADEADVQHCAAILGVVFERDMRVLADEVTRLSAVTGQLRALAARWQATVRPGEAHPAAAAILTILDGDGPSVQDCAAYDRAWFDGEKAGER